MNSSVTVSDPVYIWFFGYIGNTFYPQYELNISTQAMISTAKNLSETFGKNNLVLVTAVDEIPLPGGDITNSSSNISAISSYVSQLHKYAATVWGRLDFYQFNLTATSYGNCKTWSKCPIYNQTSLYVHQLGLDGIWYDHPSQYWNVTGSVKFNKMMQNLTELFPKTRFILNQTPGGIIGYVQELKGYTWGNQTWVAPSPPQNKTLPNLKQIQIEQKLFPGHVLLHFDARGPPAIGEDKFEPMSIFAADSASEEASILTKLVYGGTHPASMNQFYGMVIPLVGSWTYNGSIHGSRNYNGTLYNGLQTGNYARSTILAFEKLILNNNPRIKVNPTSGSVHTPVSVKGYFLLHRSTVTIKFDGTTVATVKTRSNGDFSKSFNVPSVSMGSHNISVTDGINTLRVAFDVT